MKRGDSKEAQRMRAWKKQATPAQLAAYKKHRAKKRAAWKLTDAGKASIALGKRNAYAKAKAFIDSFRTKCAVCGETEKCCLQFHHKDPNSKDGNVNSLSTQSQKRIEEEINKCVVVCANCHCKIHAGVIKCPN